MRWDDLGFLLHLSLCEILRHHNQRHVKSTSCATLALLDAAKCGVRCPCIPHLMLALVSHWSCVLSNMYTAQVGEATVAAFITSFGPMMDTKSVILYTCFSDYHSSCTEPLPVFGTIHFDTSPWPTGWSTEAINFHYLSLKLTVQTRKRSVQAGGVLVQVAFNTVLNV